MNNSSSICILIGTYNAEIFLPEQLLFIEDHSDK